MNEQETFKIEVDKNGKSYFYTGTVSPYSDEEIMIQTIYDEELVFRKEQILQKQKFSTAPQAGVRRNEQRRKDYEDVQV